MQAFIAPIPLARTASLAPASSLRRLAPTVPCHTAPAPSFRRLAPTSPPHAAPARTMFGFGAASATSAIGKGDKAPAFSALDQAGNTVSLSDFAGKRAIALFFYPKDFTPGCTKQVCSFRDAVDEFATLDAAVLGVSAGTEHKQFDEKFALKFPLLVDEGDKLRKAFGVPSTFGLLPGRVTYIIDKEGVVREVYNSQLNTGEHVKVARKTLKMLAKA